MPPSYHEPGEVGPRRSRSPRSTSLGQPRPTVAHQRLRLDVLVPEQRAGLHAHGRRAIADWGLASARPEPHRRFRPLGSHDQSYMGPIHASALPRVCRRRRILIQLDQTSADGRAEAPPRSREEPRYPRQAASFSPLRLLNGSEGVSRQLLLLGRPERPREGAAPERVSRLRARLGCALVLFDPVRSGAVCCGNAEPASLVARTFRFGLQRGWRRRLASDAPRPRARRRPPRRRSAGTRPTARRASAGATPPSPPTEAHEGAHAHPDTSTTNERRIRSAVLAGRPTRERPRRRRSTQPGPG